jgi:exopolysaccharide biosynthesis polyprenyl glycosylphosphotransferase
MIRERISLILKLYLLLDVGIIAVSFLAAYALRNELAVLFPTLIPLQAFHEYTFLLYAILPIWTTFLYLNKAYISHRGKSYQPVLWAVVKSNLEGVCGLSLVFFVFQQHTFNRSLVFAFMLVSTVLLTAEKIMVVTSLQWLRKQGRNIKHVLVIGADPKVQNLVKIINQHPETGFVIRGFLSEFSEDVGHKLYGHKVLGTIEDLYRVLHTEIIDEVIFATPIFALHKIKPSLEVCQVMGINSRIAVDTETDPTQCEMFIDNILELPLISFSYRGSKYYSLGVKRIADVILAATALILLAPVLAVIALLIKRDSPGPILFKQVRSGLNGRKFVMYKFRTMVDGAEAQRQHLQQFNEVSGPIFKMKSDPRITNIGKTLRRTSLDELPQLWNVFKGEMSLVGPRPLPLLESAQITGQERRRLSMKPGITGIWQCHGRSDAHYEHLIRMDLAYVDHWSLLLDLKLLIKTIPVVIKCIGAM